MPASMKSLAQAKDATGQVSSVVGLWRQDKRYYSVQVTDCDPEARNCQVVFDDAYKCWLEAKELHCQLDLEKLDDEEIVCCVCEGGHSEPPNDIIICDFCQQGYHLSCHQPAVDRTQAQLDDDQIEWLCNTCQQLAIQSAAPAPSAPVRKAVSTPKSTPTPKVARTPKLACTPKISLTTKVAATPKATPATKVPSTTELAATPKAAPTPKPALVPKPEPSQNDEQPIETVAVAPASNSMVCDSKPTEGRVEKMSPLIIRTAQALGTGEFMELLGEDRELVESLRAASSKSKRGHRKKIKANSAAAY